VTGPKGNTIKAMVSHDTNKSLNPISSRYTHHSFRSSTNAPSAPPATSTSSKTPSPSSPISLRA
jgi:hypothetical protein